MVWFNCLFDFTQWKKLPHFIAVLAKMNILSNFWITDSNLWITISKPMSSIHQPLSPGQVFLNLNHFLNIWYPLCFRLPIPFCLSSHSGWFPYSLTSMETLPPLPAVDSWHVPRVQTKLWLLTIRLSGLESVLLCHWGKGDAAHFSCALLPPLKHSCSFHPRGIWGTSLQARLPTFPGLSLPPSTLLARSLCSRLMLCW